VSLHNDGSRISIVILTNQRASLLCRCLDSILQNGIDPTKQEVIVIVNGENNIETLEALKRYPKFFRTLVIPQTLPGEARNSAIREARFEWLFFLDDDAYLPAGTFVQLERSLKRFPQCDVLGGPNLTPPRSTSFQAAVGKALASRFGAHFSSRRFKEQKWQGVCGEESVMLCNLLVRRNLLIESGIRFNSKMTCNEENLLLQELKLHGAEVYFDSGFTVFHDRRDKLMGLIRQIFKYGMGRAENTRIRPTSFRWQHGLPSLCILVASFFPWMLISPLAVTYLALLAFNSIQQREIRLFYIFPAIHLSYGIGFLTGCLSYVPYCVPISRRVAVWALSATGRIARS